MIHGCKDGKLPSVSCSRLNQSLCPLVHVVWYVQRHICMCKRVGGFNFIFNLNTSDLVCLVF